MSLFFETSQAMLLVLCLASFLVRSLRPFRFIGSFFPIFAHLVCSCPLSVAVRADIGLFFWQEWKVLSSCCLALCQYRQVVRVWCHVRWLVPAVCRSQPINLQRHSTYCHLIALLTLISPWKQTLQNEVSPQTTVSQVHDKVDYCASVGLGTWGNLHHFSVLHFCSIILCPFGKLFLCMDIDLK